MCQFKSAIVLHDEREKGGFRLLMSAWTESHSELCQVFKIKDGSRLTFARVEFSPASMDKAYLPEEYSLHIDEERTPEWFSEEMKTAVADKMRDYIKRIIIDGDVDLLMGGQFILAPTAKVACAKSVVINVMTGGYVGEMWGSANVGEMWGSANVGVMRESANVGEMWGSAKVGVMWGSANVGENNTTTKI